MVRLPIPDSDDGRWGQILNAYLTVEHNADGTLKNVVRPTDISSKADDTTVVHISGDETITGIKRFASGTSVGGVPLTGITDWINVRQYPYSASGNGITDDTAAINNAVAAATTAKVPVFFPAGTYRISAALNWKIPGLQVYGDGSANTSILQSTNNTAVIQIAGAGQRISGITLKYNSQQSSAQTASIGLELGDDTVGSCFESTFEDIYVKLANVGLAISPSIATVAGLFSCTFTNIHVLGYSVSGLRLIGGNGVAANATGCVFNNIYVHNNFSGSDANSTSWPVFLQKWDEVVFNQLNIEHAQVYNSDALAIVSVGSAVINSLHFEHLELSGNPGNGFVYVSQASTAIINGMSIRYPTMTGVSYNSIIRMYGAGPTCLLNGLNEPNDSGVHTNHPIVNFNSATNATVIVQGIAANQATSNSINAGTGCNVQVGLISGGDLTGTYPNPTVVKVNGVSVGGTAGAGKILLATSDSAASRNTLAASNIPSTLSATAFSGAITPSAGIVPYSTGFTSFGTGGNPNLLNTSSGASTVMTAGTWYYAALFIPYNVTLTGIIVSSGTAGGTDSWIVALWPASGGTALANSSTACIAAPAANTKKQFAFTAPVNINGPGAYIIGLQSNGTTARFLSFPNAIEGFVTGTTVGSFGTVASLAPANTYTPNVGPFASTY